MFSPGVLVRSEVGRTGVPVLYDAAGPQESEEQSEEDDADDHEDRLVVGGLLGHGLSPCDLAKPTIAGKRAGLWSVCHSDQRGGIFVFDFLRPLFLCG